MNREHHFKPNLPIQDVYCGCEAPGIKGHYFFWPQNPMRQARPAELDHYFRDWFALDGRFRPPPSQRDGRLADWEGACALHHLFFLGQAGRHADIVNFTILSFHDYSVDTRPNSHCTFVLHKGPLTFDEAVAEAKHLFPQVFDRIRYELILVHETRSKLT